MTPSKALSTVGTFLIIMLMTFSASVAGAQEITSPQAPESFPSVTKIPPAPLTASPTSPFVSVFSPFSSPTFFPMPLIGSMFTPIAPETSGHFQPGNDTPNMQQIPPSQLNKPLF